MMYMSGNEGLLQNQKRTNELLEKVKNDLVEKINNNSIKYKSLQEEYSKHKQWYETATSKANKNGNFKKMTELHKKMKEICL